MVPISARSRGPIKVLLSIESRSCRASAADSTGVLPRFTTLRPAHRGRWIEFQNSAGGQVVEQLPDGRQVLFDGRLRSLVAELLDVRRDRDCLDLVKFEAVLVAPVEELLYRARVSHARVAVTDTGGKEFDEAAAGAFALSAHDRRQRLDPGANQRRRRLDPGADQRRRRLDLV